MELTDVGLQSERRAAGRVGPVTGRSSHDILVGTAVGDPGKPPAPPQLPESPSPQTPEAGQGNNVDKARVNMSKNKSS